jgi:hypothetical protein
MCEYHQLVTNSKFRIIHIDQLCLFLAPFQSRMTSLLTTIHAMLFIFGSQKLPSLFKIKVFNALQTQFGPSKYTSLKSSKQPFKTQPQTENEDVTWKPST